LFTHFARRWCVQVEEVDQLLTLRSQRLNGPTGDDPEVVTEGDHGGIKQRDQGLLDGVAARAGVNEVAVVPLSVGVQDDRHEMVSGKGSSPVRIPGFALQAVHAAERELVAEPRLEVAVILVPDGAMTAPVGL